jgi:hypothetical protein
MMDLGGQRTTIGVWHLQINQRRVEVRARQQGACLDRGADRAASVTQPTCHVAERMSNFGQTLSEWGSRWLVAYDPSRNRLFMRSGKLRFLKRSMTS